MSAFDLNTSFLRAEARLKGPRRPRADRGQARISQVVEAFLHKRLRTHDRPSLSALSREVAKYCRSRGLPAPARTTLYGAIDRAPAPRFRMSSLPDAVQAALYNLHSEGGGAALHVPGDQIVFYALNYGSPRAISFAAGLPWLCLWRALGRTGYRPKSRALLRAIMDFRGI